MPRVLVIDDDRSVVPLIRSACKHVGEIDVIAAETAEEGLKLLKAHPPDVVLLDVMLPGVSGLELFDRVRKIDERVPVIFITAGGRSDTAIEAMKLGAYDYLLKPLDVRQLRGAGRAGARDPPADARAGRECAESERADADRWRRARRPQPRDAGGLQGDRPRRPAERHRADPRRKRHRQGTGRPRHLPAQPARRQAVPGGQLRRHSRDAAGKRAVRPREGRVHRRRPAPHRQVRAVRRRHALPRRNRRHDAAACRARCCACCRSSGSSASAATKTIQTDVRVIAATNRDLEEMVAEGRVPRGPVLPPQRASRSSCRRCETRRTTCSLLVEHFLARVHPQDCGKPLQGISPEAARAAGHYAWPGNVRELQSVLRQVPA